MGILDWLFGRENGKITMRPQDSLHKINPGSCLNLEGTRFLLFDKEEPFFDESRNSGQAAIILQFTDYWAVSGRGYSTKAISGGARLLCASCLVDMAMSFQMTLPGGMSLGNVVAFGEGLPSNLFSAAKAAKCPYCGSPRGLIVWDYPRYEDITELDMQAIRELWKFRCGLWWGQNNRSEGICDYCNCSISRGEGYHTGSRVICQKCAVKSTDSEALSRLQKKPDYFGTSELRRARNLKSGAWRFERASIMTI